MSDEVLTIKLTAREIDLLHHCIGTNIETVKRRHPMTGSTADLIQELGELSDDLLEQRFRPEDPDLFMDPVDFAAKHDIEPDQIVICDAEIKTGVNHDRHIAETQMFNAGVDAREKMKAASRAAERRALNLRGSRDESKRSEMQDVDVWAKPSNDPADW
jgi:hypothetical protein